MRTRFCIVMGVSGSGKTSVGQALASELGWDYYDADNFHPPENVAKMAKGIPLDDSDRAPWLEILHNLITSSLQAGHRGVLACSALKQSYRQQLTQGCQDVEIIHLRGSYDLIWSRMEQRSEHFMKAHMLQSQFETLEEPQGALTVDISAPIDEIVKTILDRLP